MAGVYCLGIATLDFVYKLDALPTRGEKYRARELAVVGGGCAAIASVAIARLGGRAWLATRLADDATGDAIRAELEREGVDAAGSRVVPDLRSPTSAIFVDAQGERMVVSYSDPDMPEDADWLPEALPPEADAVLVDTRWGAGSLAALHLARQASKPGVLDGDRQLPHPDLLTVASHIAFSAQALRDIAGEADPRQALLALTRRTDAWLAVTLGPDGVLFVDRGEIAHSPAFRVETVDTLGAGDVWHGAFALALAEGQDERAAIRFASAAAAIKCMRFGGRAGTPDRAELEAFLSDR